MENNSFHFLSQEFSEFESFLKEYLNLRFKTNAEKGLTELGKSIQYTLFLPCKRFRPALSFGTAQALGMDYKKTFPLAGAVEFIHTASLIHDDLPSMDNDFKRRGRDCNHIVFNEDIALLAGSALLIEAFYLLGHFQQSASVIQCVAESASFSGMMGGQALDLRPEQPLSFSYVQKLYEMKTGALIQASIEGVLCLKKDLDDKTRKAFQKCALDLGRAFQLADDLQDKQEKGSMLQLMDEEKVFRLLEEWTEKSLKNLQNIPAPLLKKLIESNRLRAGEN